MSPLRTDVLILTGSIAVMLVVRFWASLAGSELLGLVTLLRIAAGGAILGGVVAVWSSRGRSAVALAIGVSVATIVASVLTRGGFDPEAAVGASLIAVVVSLGSYVFVRRLSAWVRVRGRAAQVAFAVVGSVIAAALVIALASAR